MAFINVKNLSFTYPLAEGRAIKNFSLQVEKGQFIVLFGPSGSGKSTLLQMLKKEIQPNGALEGEITINGENLQELDKLSTNIGFVFQDPENQVVADHVLHELVFGLENIGVPTALMRSRVAEIVHYFDAESFLHRSTHELSGGKKQQINLAAVLLMQPDILLLDEPTAQLDPVSAREFLNILERLNEEFGMTIILAEHRLDEVFTLADKIVLMDEGRMIAEGEPQEVLQSIWNTEHRQFVPSIPSLYFTVSNESVSDVIPLTVKEGKRWLQGISFKNAFDEVVSGPILENLEVLSARNAYFQYDKLRGFVLKDLNFQLQRGEIYALLGGNGSGKSTLLKLLGGLIQPFSGKVMMFEKSLKAWGMGEVVKKIGYLPQNPKLFFIHDTVEKEINETVAKWGVTDFTYVDLLVSEFGISHLMNNHPFDLSGGELQKAALVCLLIKKPEILLLDEPTKGLDPRSKHQFGQILQRLKVEGMTIVMSTHDIEFAAHHATKCGMMFEGEITVENVPRTFFKGNFFYTTMIQRLFRNVANQGVVTLEEAIALWG